MRVVQGKRALREESHQRLRETMRMGSVPPFLHARREHVSQ